MNKAVKTEAKVIKTWIQEKFNPERFEHRKAIERMVLAIWDRQTPREKNSKDTIERNGRGFNGRDADFASRIIDAINNPDYSCISRGLAKSAAKMIAKYSRQLAETKLTRNYT